MVRDIVGSFRPGSSFGIGSLPHRDIDDALNFALTSSTIPTIPSLPRRSPAESMVAQALVGIAGVSVGQYGGINLDIGAIDVEADITTDLASDAYRTFDAFVSSCRDTTQTERQSRGSIPSQIKWQFVGPATLGVALVRVGLSPDVAFRLALHAVREHIAALQETIDRACPDVQQIIVLDEPSLPHALMPEFELDNESVVDLVSGALAAISPRHMTGVHCCAQADWNMLLSTGATVLSVPLPVDDASRDNLTQAAVRVSDHLTHGGYVAWGAVRTDGPIATTAQRSWRSLMETMCDLVRAGVDPVQLRRRSFVTPACGLAGMSENLAARVMTHVGEVSDNVAQQMTASRLSMGS